VPQNALNPVTLGRAIEGEPRSRRRATAIRWCGAPSTFAQKLEGLTRHASTHAAGIVIGDRPLTELVPLYRDPKSLMPVTQFNMKWVEPAGLVKFDFLGLTTLTVLDLAARWCGGAASRSTSRTCRSMTPSPTTSWRAGDTVGVFQVESSGMRRALVDMRPGPL
jgi:DNA polymerase-3 subunit alpha